MFSSERDSRLDCPQQTFRGPVDCSACYEGLTEKRIPSPRCLYIENGFKYLLSDIGTYDNKMFTGGNSSKLHKILEVLFLLCDDHKFKDEILFYRFRYDETIHGCEQDLQMFFSGLDIYHSITSSKKGILRSYHLRGQTYHGTFMGSAFVDWLVKSEIRVTKEEAIILGRQLVENDIIRHVTDDHHFRNDNLLLYQFTIDFEHKHHFGEILELDEQRKMSSCSRTSTDSQETCHELQHEINSQCSESDVLEESTAEDTESEENVPTQPKSVLLRYETVDDLESPDTPYIKHCLRVFSDCVGYGFVVRGNGPTYIQTVDPAGPAAYAGLKVRQYIYSINGKNVLREDHHAVAKIIMENTDYINICVMTHKRDIS